MNEQPEKVEVTVVAQKDGKPPQPDASAAEDDTPAQATVRRRKPRKPRTRKDKGKDVVQPGPQESGPSDTDAAGSESATRGEFLMSRFHNLVSFVEDELRESRPGIAELAHMAREYATPETLLYVLATLVEPRIPDRELGPGELREVVMEPTLQWLRNNAPAQYQGVIPESPLDFKSGATAWDKLHRYMRFGLWIMKS